MRDQIDEEKVASLDTKIAEACVKAGNYALFYGTGFVKFSIPNGVFTVEVLEPNDYLEIPLDAEKFDA